MRLQLRGGVQHCVGGVILCISMLEVPSEGADCRYGCTLHLQTVQAGCTLQAVLHIVVEVAVGLNPLRVVLLA